MFTNMKIALSAAVILGVFAPVSAALAESDHEGRGGGYEGQSWHEIPLQNQYRMGVADDAYGSFGPANQQEDLSQWRKKSRSH
jgi:hypothetical protein